jgi:hypothetical protein
VLSSSLAANDHEFGGCSTAIIKYSAPRCSS